MKGRYQYEKAKNLLEDYTVEVTYSTNMKESDEILRRFAHYLIQFGIKEKTLPTPPGYNKSYDVIL